MKLFTGLRRRWHDFMHNEELKQKIYKVVFESDTPQGKLFDIILMLQHCFECTSGHNGEYAHISSFGLSGSQSAGVSAHLHFLVRISGAHILLETAGKVHFQLFRNCGPFDHIACLSQLFPARVALSAGHTCLPSDTYIPSVQAFHVHQRRKSASALIVDRCS